MINVDPHQQFYDPAQLYYDPTVGMLQPTFVPGNQMLMKQPKMKKQGGSGPNNMPSLHFPAILLLAFSWVLHALATFIPYWSTYSGISGSRAGLWSARNFNYYSIQNFYFPEPFTYGNVTNSLRFTSANTKGYLVTVQFLMTFNFVLMFIVLVLLIVDFIVAQNPVNRSRSFLIRDYNTSDTVVKFALLLYIIYVFGVFEFAAWITYVASRHDNNWKMHVSFAFTVIVSVFLVIVFILYILEFIRIFKLTRKKWEYWYGPYVEWAFFIHLSALLLMLTVICCPEWAYAKVSSLNIFAEIGLFKQCYFTIIYKDTASTHICTLSNTSSNQSWVNVAQAFMLMAYIIGMIILIVMVVFRKEFRHNAQGYHPGRVPQPLFTYIIAGLILFFCFIFTLIAVAVFGGKVFPNSVTVNWAYIIAVFAMVLFLIAGILFILDAVHSQKQIGGKKPSSVRKTFFPPPLNYRVLATKPLLPPQSAPMNPSPFDMQQLAMYSAQNLNNPSFYPEQQMMMMPMNPGMEQYPMAPIDQAALAEYLRQMQNNPQLSSLPLNQGLMNYSNTNPIYNVNNLNKNMNDMVRQHFVQQQRLNYNHERLLERYSRLSAPRISEYRTFGSSSLPGRNYDNYLRGMRSDDRRGDSLAAWSRAAIGSSDETYRWMGDDSNEPLPRGVSSIMQHARNDPMPSVRAENFEPIEIYNHPVFGPTPAYIRPVFKKITYSKRNHDDSDDEIDLIYSDREGGGGGNDDEKNPISTISIHDANKISNHIPLGHRSVKNLKKKRNRVVPVNPRLFDMYNQRSNGSIQAYGQSLYVPTGHHNHDKQSSHYEDISNLPPSSNTNLVLSHATSTSSASKNQRYDKLESQPITTTVSHRLSGPSKTELTSSTALSNPLVPLSMPSMSTKKPESISTVTSVAPYQTLSSIYNNSGTAAPTVDSTKTSSSQKKIIPTNNKPTTDVISNSSDSDSDDDDDDNNKKNKKSRQQKKKSATATNGNADVNSSSSDD